jgi:hypothetical protein
MGLLRGTLLTLLEEPSREGLRGKQLQTCAFHLPGYKMKSLHGDPFTNGMNAQPFRICEANRCMVLHLATITTQAISSRTILLVRCKV